MKLLLLRSYCYPDKTAGTHLLDELVEDLTDRDIIVEQYAPIPCRSSSIEDRKKYSSKKHKYEVSKNEKLITHRFWLPMESKNVWLRFGRYIIQNVVQFIKGIGCKKVDVIYLSSTPPTNGFFGALLKKVKKVKFIYNVQDLFPESMISSGMVKEDSLIVKIANKMQKFAYKNADVITVISEDMQTKMLELNIDNKKIKIIPNWVDENKIHPVQDKNNYMYKKYPIEQEKFNVVYAGNLGKAQNVEILLKAAEMTSDIKEIQYIIFGNGVCEDDIKNQIKNRSNVQIFPLQEERYVSDVYSLGDVALVCCKKGFGSSAMPSKTWSIMATGTAVLASFDKDTELEKIIVNQDAGYFSDAEDVGGLVNNILDAYKNPKVLNEKGVRAKDYVTEHLSRNKCTDAYYKIIDSCKEIGDVKDYEI